MKTYTIGILGAGFMGRAHTYCWNNLSLFYKDLPFRVKVHAIATSREASAKAGMEALGAEKWYDNARALIEDPDIDIVDIASPNRFHKDALLLSHKAQKKVYCDKPLTGNLHEALEIEKAIDDLDHAGQLTLQCRFFPATMRAKQLVAKGRLGDPIHFRTVYLHSGNVAEGKPVGFKDMRSMGGGVLFDMGPHVVDLVTWLCNADLGEVLAAQKVLNPRRNVKDDPTVMVRQDGDDMTVCIVRLSNGALGTLEASKIATGMQDELRFEIHGTQGAIRFNLMQPNYLDFFDVSDPEAPLGGDSGFKRLNCVGRYDSPAAFPPPKMGIGWLRGHMHCAFSFLQHVDRNEPFDPSLRRGVELEKMLQKIQSAAETGGEVAGK